MRWKARRKNYDLAPDRRLTYRFYYQSPENSIYWHTMSLNPACKAGPSALPIMLFSSNITLIRPRRDSKEARDSERLTNKSVGFGKKTSSMSETTSIEESVVPG